MSLLISAGILIGLALWGFGCHWASIARVTPLPSSEAAPPQMRGKRRAAALMLLLSAAAMNRVSAQAPEAQPSPATPIAASSATVVPMLVRYDGVASQGDGKPKTGTVTFLVYKEEQGGEALWTETQSVAFDQNGKYEIYLGSTRSSGLPTDLFGSGEARWLEVQIAGEPVQPRALLVSVPYALHAADAATLGGLPASAFMRAGVSGASPSAAPAAAAAASSLTVTTPGGTSNRVPVFTGPSTIGNSILYATPTAIGIGRSPSIYGVLDVGGESIFRGPLDVSRIGDATASAGTNSNPFLFNFQFYNSAAKFVYNPYFSFQAEAKGNNTANPAGTMNLLYYNGIGGVAKETGLYFNTDGSIHFAPSQTFPGAGGTITGVTAGTGLTGGGTSGAVTLSVDNTKIPTLAGNNSLTGSDTFVASLYEQTDVNIDSTNRNPGNISPGLRFGVASGEGMSSKRTAGGNQYGLDLYTDYQPRLSISAAGQVAIGTGAQFSGSQLQVQSTSGTAVQGTSGQYSGVAGSSTSGPGVQGTSNTGFGGQFTASSSSAAVYAVNNAASGGVSFSGTSTGMDGIGLYANAQGKGGTAIEGIALAGNDSNGVQPVGVYGYSTANGVLGSSTGVTLNTAGVLGVAAGRTGYGGIAGVWGDALGHIGVIGSSDQYPGVLGNSGSGDGVDGISSSRVGMYGIGGKSATSYSSAFGNMLIGVWGDTTGNSTLYSSPESVAVAGTATEGNAGRFTNNSDQPTLYAFNYGGGFGSYTNFKLFEASTPNGTCGFGGNGDLTCTGQMKSLATTGNSARTVETYSMQSPENWMEDFGSGSLQNGRATISLEAGFAETVSGSADYHVFLTPNGDSKGLYVFAKTATSFEVRESGGGTSTLAFDYRIVAKRRGFESQRMVDVTEAMKAVKTRHDTQAALYKATGRR